ncbi:MAG: cell wall hydrolase [Bacillota bacterium]|nr:cell wall hydrolase [Bacillota bacterium]
MKFKFKLPVTVLAMTLMFLCSVGVSAAEVNTTYTVQNGDTVYKIAQKFNVDQSAIINGNGLSNGGTLIYPGMNLRIDSNAKNNPNGNYAVSNGDTLYCLAQSYGLSVESIMTANGLTADRIYSGQKIYLEGAASAPEDNDSAADPSITLTEDELWMMAKMIYGEARGESYEGQVAVGAVIMNRIESPLFPNTMYGVLFQKNQFSAVDDGQYYLTPNATAVAAAKDAARGVDPTHGSLFYWNPVKAPNNAFLNSKEIVATIGGHVFAK